jgi:hypothetical protein
MSTQDLDDKVEGGPSSRVMGWLVGCAFVVLVIVGIVMIVQSVRTADVASQTRDLVRIQQEAQARADCRTAYNSARQVVLERAAADANDANLDFAGFLLGDPSTPASKLMDNRKTLDAANTAVKNLPTLDQMVDKGYRFDGEPAHPPCPKVGK